MNERTAMSHLSARVGHGLSTGVLALALLTTGACGKKEAEKKADDAKPATAATESGDKPAGTPEAATATGAAAESPKPETGYDYNAFYTARLLQKCALKYGVAEKKAEALAIDMVAGKKPALDLDAVLKKPDAKAKPAPEPVLTHEDELAREKWRNAVRLGEAHTETEAKLKAETETCLYAPEAGMIEAKTIDAYVKIFAGVTCLQKELVSAGGKLDEMGHAQAAGKLFNENGMSAGDFSRYGLIFSRFPVIVQKQYAARAALCPETGAPKVTAPLPPPSAIYNGGLEGERMGALRLEVRDGKVTGAVQWQGVPPPAMDGRPQPPAIVAVSGTIGPKGLTLAGDVQGETLKLVGKAGPEGGSGTWLSGRPDGKTKGTWKAEFIAPSAIK